MIQMKWTQISVLFTVSESTYYFFVLFILSVKFRRLFPLRRLFAVIVLIEALFDLIIVLDFGMVCRILLIIYYISAIM